MKNSRAIVLFAPLLIFLATGFVLAPFGQAANSAGQDADKSLDIERYPNEPLELVELKVGEQAIKNKITIKFRRNDEGLDSVTFKERDGWFRRIRVRMRNTSGKPIVGVRAHLYFKPPGSQTLFSVDLNASTELKQGLLEPDAEVDLAVVEQRWNLTADILKQHAVDPDLASVTLSVENVAFRDGLQWHKGHIVHRDPDNPNRWIPIGKVGP